MTFKYNDYNDKTDTLGIEKKRERTLKRKDDKSKTKQFIDRSNRKKQIFKEFIKTPCWESKKIWVLVLVLEFMFGLVMCSLFFLMMGDSLWSWSGLLFCFDFIVYLFMKYQEEERIYSIFSTILIFFVSVVFCFKYFFYVLSFVCSFFNFHRKNKKIVDCIAIIIQSKFMIFTIIDFIAVYYFIILIKQNYVHKNEKSSWSLSKIDDVSIIGWGCQLIRMLILSVLALKTGTVAIRSLFSIFLFNLIYNILMVCIQRYEYKDYMQFNRIMKRESISFMLIFILQRIVCEHYAVNNFDNISSMESMFDLEFYRNNLSNYFFN